MKDPYKPISQSSSVSRLYHVSNSDSATRGPITGGIGGGLLNAIIGSGLLFITGPILTKSSLFPFFFGAAMAFIPGFAIIVLFEFEFQMNEIDKYIFRYVMLQEEGFCNL